MKRIRKRVKVQTNTLNQKKKVFKLTHSLTQTDTYGYHHTRKGDREQCTRRTRILT